MCVFDSFTGLQSWVRVNNKRKGSSSSGRSTKTVTFLSVIGFTLVIAFPRDAAFIVTRELYKIQRTQNWYVKQCKAARDQRTFSRYALVVQVKSMLCHCLWVRESTEDDSTNLLKIYNQAEERFSPSQKIEAQTIPWEIGYNTTRTIESGQVVFSIRSWAVRSSYLPGASMWYELRLRDLTIYDLRYLVIPVYLRGILGASTYPGGKSSCFSLLSNILLR